ncbi:class I SAM-dependent methyltransferase [Candidatus Nomurabacteria bacterium]|nr:class I SAM-dependent methyltransferase [Candidatus Kaiserbacteria bacterium]MCB9815104.1 class I SAM-dependent methyltransferase [Candidatus Nomurabacteria bacterium]
MSLETLSNLIKPNCTIEKDDIYVAKEIADKTVWDKLAVENPTHAVISAGNEEEAFKKSSEQINDLKHFLKPEDVLLDCGAGYGRVAKYLLPSMNLAGYIGVDSSYEMLGLFKKRYRDNQAEQKTPLLLLNADIHTIPLKDSSIDVAIVCAVFLHNHKSVVENAMLEIKRVVKPGGRVLVYSSFPRSATFMGLQGHTYQMLLNLMGKPFKNGPVRYYRSKEIMRLFEGFTEVELRPVGYSVLPKTLIFIPKPLEIVWRVGLAKPINKVLEKITPARLKPYFAVHYDVIAVK